MAAGWGARRQGLQTRAAPSSGGRGGSEIGTRNECEHLGDWEELPPQFALPPQ
jgi:hypothetical protein